MILKFLFLQNFKIIPDILQKSFKAPFYLQYYRIVLAPVTRMRASSSGVPSTTAATYY